VDYAHEQITDLRSVQSTIKQGVPSTMEIFRKYFHSRKNALFVGNPRDGRMAAILAGLTSTCRRHDVDPQLYITQLLVNLPIISISERLSGFPTSGNHSAHAAL
jgi:hypothetical protein